MKDAIRKRSRDFIAVAAMFIAAFGVGAYILGHQRLVVPGWVPIFGQHHYVLKGEFSTAQAVMPGQGQSVNVAGVQVGEVAGVSLENGRAIVSMNIQKKYTPIYRDATMLLRPKTNLKDMTIQLDPGTPAAGAFPNGGTVPIKNTLPDINTDEIFQNFDSDTRAYLRLLLQGGAEALKDGNGRTLSSVLRRFSPTSRDVARISKLIAERRDHLRRVIHNFGLVAQALGEKDAQVARFVESSRQVFDTFAEQDRNLQATLRQLPGTLEATNQGLAKTQRFATAFGAATQALRPGVRALAPSEQAAQRFFSGSIDPLERQIKPFAHEALPVVSRLRPAANNLAATSPDLLSSTKVINRIFNELAYDPPGKQEGYLYYLAWANHLANGMFSLSDGTGTLRRGMLYVGCTSLSALKSLAVGETANPIIQTAVGLTNAPVESAKCPKAETGGQ